MAVYNVSKLFDPQYVAAAAAALAFAPPGAGTAVPANFSYQINVLRVTNVTASPVSLTVYRVPSGSAADIAHVVVPVTVLVPVATQTFPHMDITALWGAVLTTGDSIWAAAGAASSLVIHGDGIIVTI